MALKKEMMKRAGMVIRAIMERNRLTNSRMSRIMGCGKNTIQNYKSSITMPPLTFIAKLANYYGVSVNWVHFGEGVPFHVDGTGPRRPPEKGGDAPVEYPLAGSVGTAFDKAETAAIPGSAYSPTKDLRISSLALRAARILESNTPYGELLHQNIEMLNKGLAAEKETMELESEIKQVRSKIKSRAARGVR